MAVKEPRYRQLADELVAAIGDGEFPVGSKLPTEAELCARHSLSRGTVRQAMRELEELGLIERRTRAGTVVTCAEPIAPYVPVVESGDDIARMVRRTTVTEPAAAEIAADDELALRLGVEAGSRWFRVTGLRVIRDGEPGLPLCWSEQYLAAELPAASRAIALRGQFEASDIRSNRIEQEVRAELLPVLLAAALGEPAGSAALVVIRRYFNGERLTAVSVNTHSGARFSVNSVLAAGDR